MESIRRVMYLLTSSSDHKTIHLDILHNADILDWMRLGPD